MEAVIFDCDGVVLDSQKLWDSAVLEPWNETFPTMKLTDGGRFRGRSEQDAWGEISSQFPASRSAEDHWRHMESLVHGIYEQAELVQGVHDLIIVVKRKMKIAIASSSKRAWFEQALHRHQIHGNFETIVGAEDAPRAKPFPDLYLEARKRLGVDACLAIEDTAAGIRSAKAAGMRAVGLRNPLYKEILDEADHVVDHLSEVINIIKL